MLQNVAPGNDRHQGLNQQGLNNQGAERAQMIFDEIDEGDYRIFALAAPAPQRDGYVAGVVVKRRNVGLEDASIAYREDSLAGGKRWPSPVTARRFATAMAREMIRQEPHRMAR